MGRRLLHVPGRLSSLRQRGRDAPTANEAEGFLDLLVSERMYDGVDDGISSTCTLHQNTVDSWGMLKWRSQCRSEGPTKHYISGIGRCCQYGSCWESVETWVVIPIIHIENWCDHVHWIPWVLVFCLVLVFVLFFLPHLLLPWVKLVPVTHRDTHRHIHTYTHKHSQPSAHTKFGCESTETHNRHLKKLKTLFWRQIWVFMAP